MVFPQRLWKSLWKSSDFERQCYEDQRLLAFCTHSLHAPQQVCNDTIFANETRPRPDIQPRFFQNRMHVHTDDSCLRVPHAITNGAGNK